MTLKQANDNYESAKQQYLKDFGEWLKTVFPDIKNYALCGEQEYNDEEYYDDLSDLKINDESVSGDVELGKVLFAAIFPNKKLKKFQEEEPWEIWHEIKEELKENTPDFILTDTFEYTYP